MASLVGKTPHFKIPFNIKNGTVLTVDQDSEDEILQTASTVLAYQQGDRERIPTYGVPEQAMQMNGADLSILKNAILSWDDRTDVDMASKVIDGIGQQAIQVLMGANIDG